jgi:ribosomal protein S18 acetylase RimI-like enzyme
MTATATARVRRARVDDLPQVAGLIAEHAKYERAAPPPAGLVPRLEVLLFGVQAPRLRCFVAELGDDERTAPGGAADGGIVGYATCSPEISTWEGEEYLHMDCLFLRDGHRGLSLGQRLVEAVVAEARALGLREVQWQTPAWNEGAIRFYDRLGARAKDKLRYSLAVGG